MLPGICTIALTGIALVREPIIFHPAEILTVSFSSESPWTGTLWAPANFSQKPTPGR